MARVLPLSEAKARLSQLVAEVEKSEEELVITRHGRPAAVLMSADEFASWQETQEIRRNPALMREIKRGLSQLKKGQRFTFEEVFGEPLNSPHEGEPPFTAPASVDRCQATTVQAEFFHARVMVKRP